MTVHATSVAPMMERVLDADRARRRRVAARVGVAHAHPRSRLLRHGLCRDRQVAHRSLVDGARPDLDDGSARGLGGRLYFETVRRYLITNALRLGFEVVDMQPIFASDYAAHHSSFAFPTDGHWNGYAHALSAAAIESTGVFRRFERLTVSGRDK